MDGENIGDVREGFAIEPAVISPGECDTLADTISSSFESRRAGIRHLMQDESVRTIASDDRLLAIAKRFLGSVAVPYRATLFEKSGRANWLVVWHQDTALPLEQRFSSPNWGPWSTKEGINYAHAPSSALERVIALRLHLDASSSSNGPLRVIPGSHLMGVLDDGAVFDHARKNESVECTVPIGGVIAMRPLIIHASSKAKVDAPRRVLHIEYADTLEFGDNIRLTIA